ncbi:hypothetical protein HanIR_Chr16g0793351 [Helianthus annuus]|nr:hypothetical protein HanIR_Chr16g0793351 [Helianthus annuus]
MAPIPAPRTTPLSEALPAIAPVMAPVNAPAAAAQEIKSINLYLVKQLSRGELPRAKRPVRAPETAPEMNLGMK